MFSQQIKLYVTAMLFLCVSFLSCSPDTRNKNLKVAEAGMLFTSPQEYMVPQELDYCRQTAGFLKNGFRPIGWSADGKFAYIVEPADEACGCYFFEIVIKDLDGNDVLWQWTHNDDGAGENVASVWTENYDLFKKKLNEYKIMQNQSFVFNNGNSLLYDGKEFFITLETKTKLDPDYGFEFVAQADIIIQASMVGEKTLAHLVHEEPLFVLDATVTGYIQSPFEDRVAIVYKEERKGWEGPPHVVQFQIYGTELNNGF